MSAQRDSLLLLELASRLLPADFLLNEIRETHLSLVFLGAKEAWKLKKPVSYPFVDQREQQVRWQFAVEEIRLNRRLAPSIYLGFRSLSESGFSAFSTAPQHEGEPVVVMKRVPEENFAHKRVESLDPVLHIAPLAERLARFHLEERVTVGTSVSSLVAAIEENFQSLRGLPL